MAEKLLDISTIAKRVHHSKENRVFFLKGWTVDRWKSTHKFGNTVDSHMVHNVIDILAMGGNWNAEIVEEDGGLAFYNTPPRVTPEEESAFNDAVSW
jgi:hypothetical protein